MIGIALKRLGAIAPKTETDVDGLVNYVLGDWARQKFEGDPTISTALGSVGFLVRFAEEGIEFAYPTPKVYLEGGFPGAQGGS